MKKIAIATVFVLFFASSASAAIYRWVDDKGVVNFTDNYSNVAPAYRARIEEVKIPTSTRSQDSAKSTVDSHADRTQPPPIAQPLIAEGDFAMKLAEILRIGSPQNEADAESMLISRGIEPRNGWIADYPMTPDIVGELEDAVGQAADSGKLAMKKDDAIGKFRDLAFQQGLMVSADHRQYAEAETPPDYGDYSNPTVINNYYFEQGPPIVTYYPPPPDYSYLYAWVPYPFICSGFFFPGYFILNDFDRTVGHSHHGHRFHHRVTNHFRDPKTHGTHRVDPHTWGGRKTVKASEGHDRHGPRPEFTERFKTQEARKGATAISNRSFERTKFVPATPRNVNQSPPRSFNQSNRIQTQNRNLQRPRTGGGSSFGAPPGAAFGRASEQAPRPFNPSSRSFSSSRTSHQDAVDGFRGEGSRPFPRAPSAQMRSFGASSSGNGGSSGGNRGGGGGRGRF